MVVPTTHIFVTFRRGSAQRVVIEEILRPTSAAQLIGKDLVVSTDELRTSVAINWTDIIAEARTMGYERMRLDTIASSQKDAVELYRRIGLKEIARYGASPIEAAFYMELLLQFGSFTQMVS